MCNCTSSILFMSQKSGSLLLLGKGSQNIFLGLFPKTADSTHGFRNFRKIYLFLTKVSQMMPQTCLDDAADMPQTTPQTCPR